MLRSSTPRRVVACAQATRIAPTLAHTQRAFAHSAAAATAAPSTASPIVQHAPRIVSGIQPTHGAAHLGNYLGAISQWVKIQNGQPLQLDTPTDATSAAAAAAASSLLSSSGAPPPLFIFLADLHALNGRPSPSQLRSSCLSVTATLLACGVDPSRSTVFRQSSLAGLHTELTWILGASTPVSWLQRMTQFKDKARAKSSKGEEATWGLLTYPALQAADILLYRATAVPVGRDQFQHVELCRDMAHLFNGHYASASAAAAASSSGSPPPFAFPLPVHLATRLSRVMSLRSGAAKMSKSDPSDDSRLNLTDSPEVLAAKIRRAKTDSDQGIQFDPTAKPETANLVTLMAELSQQSVQQIMQQADICASKQAFKAALTDMVVHKLTPIRTEFVRLQADPAYLQQVLTEGAARAAVTAEDTMKQVRHTVGLQ